MIDTWLFASICLFILSFCAILRIMPGPTRADRLVALNAAVTLGSLGLLPLSIALGNIIFLDIAVILTFVCFAGTIFSEYQHRRVES